MLPLKSFTLLFLVLPTLLSQQCSGSLVEKTCKRAARGDPNIDYRFCVRSLRADPGSSRADLAGLGLISLRLASAKSKSTSSRVRQLLKDPSLDPDERMCLKDCSDMYSDALDLLKQCYGALKVKDYGSVNAWVSGAMDDSDSCEGGFKEKKRASPLSMENKAMFELGAIALAIINFLGA